MSCEIQITQCDLLVGGKKVRNPVVKGLVVALAMAVLGVVLLFGAMMVFLVLIGMSGLATAVFALVCAACGLMLLGNPLLRLCGRRGFIQTAQNGEGDTLLLITTKGSMQKRDAR